jgi:hypothetical protein
MNTAKSVSSWLFCFRFDNKFVSLIKKILPDEAFNVELVDLKLNNIYTEHVLINTKVSVAV